MLAKPLLLVDVDGVISLFGFEPAAAPAGQWQLIDGIGHLLSADAGRHLLALREAFELVWCTGWEEKANEYLPSLLGLGGPLPYLSFEREPGVRPVRTPNGVDASRLHAQEPGVRPVRTPNGVDASRLHAHWKLRAIDAFAGQERPLAWIDDAHDDGSRTWARQRPGPTMLLATSPAVGLTEEHVDRLLRWAGELPGVADAIIGRPRSG